MGLVMGCRLIWRLILGSRIAMDGGMELASRMEN